MLNFTRVLGILISLGALMLYVTFAFFNPYAPGGLTLPVVAMMIVSIAGACAAYYKRPYLMLIVFAVSFVPVGLYMLGTPGIFRLIGIFNLIYLLAGVLILVLARQPKTPHSAKAS